MWTAEDQHLLHPTDYLDVVPASLSPSVLVLNLRLEEAGGTGRLLPPAVWPCFPLKLLRRENRTLEFINPKVPSQLPVPSAQSF